MYVERFIQLVEDLAGDKGNEVFVSKVVEGMVHTFPVTYENVMVDDEGNIYLNFD